MTQILPSYHPVYASELALSDYLIKNNEITSLITPTGLSITKIWFSGTMISYEKDTNNNKIRVSDPTGGISFQVTPKYNNFYPDFNDLEPPLFLSLTGSIEPDKRSKNGYKIILETCEIIDKKRRDNWIILAASSLCDRLEYIIQFLKSESHESITACIQINELLAHYPELHTLLYKLGQSSVNAINVVKPAEDTKRNPSEIILDILKEKSSTKGLHIDDLTRHARNYGIGEEILKEALRQLIAEDEVYQPSPGQIKIL